MIVPLHEIATSQSRLLTDSRALVDPAKTVFFAIKTSTGDGSRYLPALYRAGVRRFVVSDASAIPAQMADAQFAIAPDGDVVAALQAIAAHHRQQYHCPVIGITGSRGKTTIKEWLAQLLSPHGVVAASPRSYNSQIGVPLSVWRIDADTAYGVFETGISRPGQMDNLAHVIQPTIGIFTNLGTGHTSDFAERGAEKGHLLKGCQCVVYNADDAEVARYVPTEPGQTRLAWSLADPKAPLYAQVTAPGHLTYTYGGETSQLVVPFTDDFDIQNCMHCLAVLLYLNISRADIARQMALLARVYTRLNLIAGVNGCQIISDGYSADIESLIPALQFMRQRLDEGRNKSTTVTAILSDFDRGDDSLYGAVARLLGDYGVKRLIGVGPQIAAHRHCFEAIADLDCQWHTDADKWLATVTPSDFVNQTILIKGAPRFALNRLNQVLEARHHETVLEVNLDALAYNYDYYKAKLKPTTGIVCMVKASGYGAGALELARTLQAKGAAYLAVAVIDEGVELRQAGITMPIMVMNPKVLNYNALFDYRLEPEIYSFEILDQVIAQAQRRGITGYPIHLKLDTGMHRMGYVKDELPEVVRRLCSQQAVRVATVFSHLATADCYDMDQYTLAQLQTFEECADVLAAGLPYPIKRHILNSAGITRFTDHQDDLVRLGIGLYGVSPLNADEQSQLRPVSSLTTVISAIRHWPAGSAIGYGRRGMLQRDSVIATIPIGYADGLNRHLGRGNIKFACGGALCPTVGNICMDACMIDVTDCAVEPRPGDTVEIFGPQVPLSVHAQALDTIPYEVLTSVSQRVKRLYYRE